MKPSVVNSWCVGFYLTIAVQYAQGGPALPPQARDAPANGNVNRPPVPPNHINNVPNVAAHAQGLENSVNNQPILAANAGVANAQQHGPPPGAGKAAPNSNIPIPVQPGLVNKNPAQPQHQPGPQPNAHMAKESHEKKFPSGKNYASSNLVDRPECMEEITELCSKQEMMSNFGIIDCLLQPSEDSKPRHISDGCQHVIYTFQKEYSTDSRILQTAKDVCKKWIVETHDVCGAIGSQSDSHLLSCIIMQTVADKSHHPESACSMFLQKMERILLRNYNYIYKFADDCDEDIKKFRCGRVSTDTSPNHLQGSTINCLVTHWSGIEAAEAAKPRQPGVPHKDPLSKACVAQIRHVAELQSNDYHLDLPLYYACREDRNKAFCADVQPGEGRIYKCLMENKFHDRMSQACQHELTRREQIIQQDAGADHTFMAECGTDITNHKCVGPEQLDSAGMEDHRMAHIIICLEEAHDSKQGKPIQPGCLSEMELVRESLMNDWEVDVNIIAQCSAELSDPCKGKGKEGKTLHCLMDLARPQKHGFKSPMSDGCRRELEELMAEIDPDEDLHIDRALLVDCSRPIGICGQNAQGGDLNGPNVLPCLMKMMKHNQLTGPCKDRLLEIQYFAVRKFRLDKQLRKACVHDAEALKCGRTHRRNEEGPDHDRYVLTCLYRNIRKEVDSLNKGIDLSQHQISEPCKFEVEKLMQARAESIDLDPELEDICMSDLAEHCSKAPEGEEVDCLESVIDKLSPKCANLMKQHLDWEDEDVTLDHILMKACSPSLEKYCTKELDDAGDNAEVIECLIAHKYEEDMDVKCRVGIEHHQLKVATNIQFNSKFKTVCGPVMEQYCHGPDYQSRSSVVICLSEMVRNDTLLDRKPPRVAGKCARQLRVELLAQEDDVEDLDMDLIKACRAELERGPCKDLQDKSEIMPCLIKHKEKLRPECHRKVFNEQKLVNAVVGMPRRLWKKCKHFITESDCGHKEEDGRLVTECIQQRLLKMRQVGDDINPQHKDCVEALDRLAIEASQDYRLNPSLESACHRDINHLCSHVIEDQLKKNPKQVEMQGEVLRCLKKEYTKANSPLSRSCASQIQLIIEGVDEDYRKDVFLSAKCASTVKRLCHDVEDEMECLKSKLHHGMAGFDAGCQLEVIRLIGETRIDVRSDAVLYRKCSVDLHRNCAGMPEGEGKKLVCLLDAQDQGLVTDKECKRLLKERAQLWQHVLSVSPPESLAEAYQDLQRSNSFSYFVTMFICFIGVLLFAGVFCGRLTKRMPMAAKNK